jgi:hypothetical protein
MLSYLHKVKDGFDLYYFANSSDEPVDTWVRLRGAKLVQQWDPHTGAMMPALPAATTQDGEVTRVRLKLDPVQSIFLVAPRQEAVA